MLECISHLQTMHILRYRFCTYIFHKKVNAQRLNKINRIISRPWKKKYYNLCVHWFATFDCLNSCWDSRIQSCEGVELFINTWIMECLRFKCWSQEMMYLSSMTVMKIYTEYLHKKGCSWILNPNIYLGTEYYYRRTKYLDEQASIPVLLVGDITSKEVLPGFSNKGVSLPVGIRFSIYPSAPTVAFF